METFNVPTTSRGVPIMEPSNETAPDMFDLRGQSDVDLSIRAESLTDLIERTARDLLYVQTAQVAREVATRFPNVDAIYLTVYEPSRVSGGYHIVASEIVPEHNDNYRKNADGLEPIVAMYAEESLKQIIRIFGHVHSVKVPISYWAEQ